MNIEKGTSELSNGEAIQPTNSIAPEAPSLEPISHDRTTHDPLLEPGFQRLDKRHITAEIIAGTIIAGIISVGGLVGLGVAWFLMPSTTWWLILAGAAAVIFLWLWFMSLIWPSREYKYASWMIDDVGLEIRRGVLWRTRTTIPRVRIQHVDISQGPLQRNFGLGELTIHTAGTQNASVKMPGLAYETAMQLRDDLISNSAESSDAV